MGTGKATTQIKALDKKMWTFIGNIDISTTMKEMNKYIEAILTHTNFECAHITNKYGANFYRIGVSERDHERITNANIWPEGTKIDRYFFRKNSTETQEDRTNGEQQLRRHTPEEHTQQVQTNFQNTKRLQNTK